MAVRPTIPITTESPRAEVTVWSERLRIASLFPALEPLWVVGLAISCLVAGHVILRSPWVDIGGKSYDWAQYAIACGIFPALLFVLPFAGRLQRRTAADVTLMKHWLTIICVVAFIALAAASGLRHGGTAVFLALVLAIAQTALMTQFWSNGQRDWPHIIAISMAAAVGWLLGLARGLGGQIQPPYLLAGLLVSLVLLCLNARDRPMSVQLTDVRILTPANFAALVFIAFMSLRTENLFVHLGERGAIHHWGAWVGAADLVREGHWLLWDAPSNYGMLNVLVLAALPTGTPWQGLYLLQALAFLVVCGSIFLIVRALGPGLLNWLLATALAVTFPLFVPKTNPAEFASSSFILPNWGAYRYICAFILVLLVLGLHRAQERSRRHTAILVVGCLVWVAGVLWSPEGAFFSTGAWIPAYCATAARMAWREPHRWRHLALWFMIPASMLALALASIAIAFVFRIGHLPDWLSYFDYAREVGLNILVATQDPLGSALTMLFGFCLLAIGASYGGTRAGLPTRAFGLWIGLMGAYCAAVSYGYQRGSLILHPIACMVLVIMLTLAAAPAVRTNWGTICRAGVIPLLAVTMTQPIAMGFANPLAARDAIASLQATAAHGFAIEYLIPDANPELQLLMANAGVTADDPIFYAADWLGNMPLPWRPVGASEGERVIAGRHWTPGHPSLALRWIPPGRGEVYTRRYIERTPMSGWLIQGKTGLGASKDFAAYAGGLEPWFFELVAETHVPTRIYQSDNWQMTWFEYVGNQAEITQPEFAWDLLGILPPDVVVDGTPLSEHPHPAVWTVFGRGWGTFDPETSTRTVESGATLWVYSPDDRTVQIQVTATQGSDNRGLSFTKFGDEPTAPRAFAADQTISQSVALEPGWNPLVFDVQPQAKERRSRKVGTNHERSREQGSRSTGATQQRFRGGEDASTNRPDDSTIAKKRGLVLRSLEITSE